jgi:hypothetical protein
MHPLNDDILYHVALFLDIGDRITVSWVCMTWRDFTNSIHDYWEKTYINSFHQQILEHAKALGTNTFQKLTTQSEDYWRTACLERLFLNNDVRMKIALEQAQKYAKNLPSLNEGSTFSDASLSILHQASSCCQLKRGIHAALLESKVFSKWCDHGSGVYAMRGKMHHTLHVVRIYAQPIEYSIMAEIDGASIPIQDQIYEHTMPYTTCAKHIDWKKLNKYVTIFLEQIGHDVIYRINCSQIFNSNKPVDIDGDNIDSISNFLGWYGFRHAFHEWYRTIVEDVGELL